MFVIITGINSGLNSQTLRTKQTTVDTLCFPVHVIQDRLIEAKQGRQLKKIVDTLKKEISLMDQTIFKQGQSITLLGIEMDRDKQIIDLQQANIHDYQKRDSLSADHIKNLNKQIKRANQKTVAVAILGTGLLILALLK